MRRRRWGSAVRPGALETSAMVRMRCGGVQRWHVTRLSERRLRGQRERSPAVHSCGAEAEAEQPSMARLCPAPLSPLPSTATKSTRHLSPSHPDDATNSCRLSSSYVTLQQALRSGSGLEWSLRLVGVLRGRQWLRRCQPPLLLPLRSP